MDTYFARAHRGRVALEALSQSMNQTLRLGAVICLIVLGIAAAAHGWWTWYRAEKAMRLSRALPGSPGTTPLAVGLVLVGVVLALALMLG